MKDLRRKIDALKENILSCQNEIVKKAEAAENIEQQIDKLEVRSMLIGIFMSKKAIEQQMALGGLNISSS